MRMTMRKTRLLSGGALAAGLACAFALAGCAGAGQDNTMTSGATATDAAAPSYITTTTESLDWYDGFDEPVIWTDPMNTEEYAAVTEHGFTSVASQPLSTFGADIDTASYCNLRRMIRDGYAPSEIPSGAVRVEEMLNYFTYDYDTPEGNDLFGVNATISNCPWNADTLLLVIGLQAKQADMRQSEGSNLVFLVDTSGSMYGEDRLDLVKDSLYYLVENLGPNDTVSLVTYSGEERVVFEGKSGKDRRGVMRAIDKLEAGGSTNGQAGLAMAYRIAQTYFIEGGNNRIIMCSDGDLNVGMTSESELEDYVSDMREAGVYLSVLGFGEGNYKDNKMETIADRGNGAYYYIDCLQEAERVLDDDLMSTMYTVADDVKFQVEFNPAYVKGYRQIGYENRELAADEFKDDSVDAGEVGSGSQITVAYELVMTDSAMDLFTADTRYQQASPGVKNGEWLCLQVRYKEPGGTMAKQNTYTFGEDNFTRRPDADWAFASQVIQLGMLLQDSENLGTTNAEDLMEEVLSAHYTDERRAEFAKLTCRILSL